MDVTQIIVVAVVVVAVLGFVAWPIVSRRRTPTPTTHAVDVDRIEARIGDYRAALRRRTLCESCLFPNIDGARFCAECGSRLPAAGQPA